LVYSLCGQFQRDRSRRERFGAFDLRRFPAGDSVCVGEACFSTIKSMAHLQSSFGVTNPVLYDVIGRTYKAGVRVAF
jgi:hypothetical protein